jgi:hypothetical protein
LTDAAGTWRVPLAWRVVPTQLAKGQLGVELVADAGTPMPRGRLDAGSRAVVLTGVDLGVPAQALRTFARPLEGAALGGVLQLDLPRFAWRDNEGSGTLNLRWRSARIAAPAGFVNLGTVTLPLSARGQGVSGPLEATGGDLRVAGSVTASLGGAAVDATLAPAPGAPAEIARALAALGSPDATGAVRIAWRSGAR